MPGPKLLSGESLNMPEPPKTGSATLATLATPEEQALLALRDLAKATTELVFRIIDIIDADEDAANPDKD
jgi:hypothetical protein